MTEEDQNFSILEMFREITSHVYLSGVIQAHLVLQLHTGVSRARLERVLGKISFKAAPCFLKSLTTLTGTLISLILTPLNKIS